MGCSNILEGNSDAPEYTGETAIPEGQGAVLLNIQSLSARTLLPSAEQLYCIATFTSGTNTVTESFGGISKKTVVLSEGTWSLVVQGYRNPSDALADTPLTPTASGSVSEIIVSSGEMTPAPVVLTAPQTGIGKLALSVSYPSEPQIIDGWIKVEQIGGAYTNKIDINPGPGTGFTRRFTLEAGYYHVSVYLFNGKNILTRDVAHIHDDLETPAAFSFTAADLAENADMTALNYAISLANIKKDGVKISPNGTWIPSGFFWATQENMGTLNAAITEAQAIVALRGTGYTLSAISAATTTLNNAVNAFTRTSGTYIPGSDADIGLYIDDDSSPEDAAGKTLASALAWLQIHGLDDTAYTILLGNDETLTPWTLGGSSGGTAIAFDGKTGVTLTLKGKSAERIVQLSGQGSLFTVYGGVTLVLDENITLKGISANNTSLVFISGNNAKLEMKAGSKITDNTNTSSSSYGGGGVYVSSGTFTMSGGTISGNTSSSSYGGGGVYVSSGTFTMSGGTISGNTTTTTSSYYSGGGGVYVSSGTFTMSGGTISDNTSSSSYYSYGGGVYVSSGTFTMSGGAISGNTSTGYYYGGGGVYVSSGTFTMSGGAISGNTTTTTTTISSSSGGGGGVYVGSSGTFTMSSGTISGNTSPSSYGGGVYSEGAFTMSGASRVALNNPVFISLGKELLIGGALSGSDPVAALELETNIGWIGKALIKWAPSQSGTLPVSRFSYPNSNMVNSSGVVSIVNPAPLSLGATSGAWLAPGDAHYYKIAATINRTYRITTTGMGMGPSVSKAYPDGTGIAAGSFIANRTGDVIVMVTGDGAYTLTYTEE
ncbi:FIVAR domain-containing protein [Treponema primitia]|uniref:FIVAR domain-containing protein n=1 Tax=Treponema primitia TaxID=88058 RepID=UPI0002D7EBEB|nr:FIVAR domain-containing protein [Treponema primitia]